MHDYANLFTPATYNIFIKSALSEQHSKYTKWKKVYDHHGGVYVTGERGEKRECWIGETRELLASELAGCQHRLLGYLVHFLARFESRHGCAAGVCGIFAPIILPHVPPATVLLRDLLLDATLIFPKSTR